jgi:hypothetical protein
MKDGLDMKFWWEEKEMHMKFCPGSSTESGHLEDEEDGRTIWKWTLVQLVVKTGPESCPIVSFGNKNVDLQNLLPDSKLVNQSEWVRKEEEAIATFSGIVQ